MNYVYEIKHYLKNNGGIITSKILKDKNIPTVYLSRLAKEGYLLKVANGIYISEDGDYDEYYFLNQRYKSIVFSYVSALYLHKFTDIIPQNMEISVYSGFNAHRIKENINIHYVSKNILEMGKIQIETVFRNKVSTYDIERTVCDLIYSKKHIETELFSKTMNRYVRYKEKNLIRLYDYSKKMGIYEKTREILEVIYE